MSTGKTIYNRRLDVDFVLPFRTVVWLTVFRIYFRQAKELSLLFTNKHNRNKLEAKYWSDIKFFLYV